MGDSALIEVETLLKQMLTPDTNVIREAVAQLNVRLKKPDIFPLLLQLLTQHPVEAIRQLSAVLMRMKVVDLWNHLPEEFLDLMKKGLLEALVREPGQLVRNSIGDLISIIARIVVPLGKWPNLLEFLFQCTQSEIPGHRVVAMRLFDRLTETIGDSFRQHTKALFQIFAKGLTDQEIAVRVASLSAVGSLIDWISTDEEIAACGDLLPHMLQVLGFCVQNDLQNEATKAFELFSDLIESPIPVVVPHVTTITKAMLEIAIKREFDLAMREMAMTVIQWMAAHKPKLLSKHQLILPCLQVSFGMCIEVNDEDEEDDEDETAYLSAHEFGCQMIDHFARVWPSKKIWLPCMEYVQKLCTSSRALDRRAALDVLTVLSDGCADKVAESLPSILEFLYQSFMDADRRVRQSACTCLGQFATHLQPEISDHHQKVLPLLIAAMGDESEQVREKSCYAVEAFCQHIGENIEPYMPELMTKLVGLIEHGETDVKEIAVAAVSALAEVAGRSFLPFYTTLIGMMKVMMQQENEEYFGLRCRATECMGMIALAVGKEVFQSVAKEFIHLACLGMKLEFCELREYTYGFFVHVSEVLGVDFLEYVPTVMTFAIASCQSGDGAIFYRDPDEQAIPGIEQEKSVNPLHVSIPQSFLDEKSAACHAVGAVAKYVGPAFLPFMAKPFEMMIEMASYSYTEARQNAITSLAELLSVVHRANLPSQQWTPGLPASQQPPLHPDTVKVLEVVVEIIATAMLKDEDRDVVSTACEAFGAIASYLGPAAAEPCYASKVFPVVLAVLQRKTVCDKQARDEYEDEDTKEDKEVLFLDSIADSTISVAKVLGPLFEPCFRECLETLLKYNAQSAQFSTVVIGLLAELCKAMGPGAVAPYIKTLLPLAFDAMRTDDDQVQRNGAFFAGILCSCAGENAGLYYTETLQRLVPLFGSEDPTVADNACGAVARMITSSISHVPLEHVLPYFLRAMPLKEDFEETEAVYSAIFRIFQSNHQVLTADGVLPQFINIFSKVLDHESMETNPRVKETMVALLKALAQQYPVTQVAAHLPHEQQQTLLKYLA